MEKDVFKFEDFLKDGSELESLKSRLIKEGIFTEDELKEASESTEEETKNDVIDDINQEYNPYTNAVDFGKGNSDGEKSEDKSEYTEEEEESEEEEEEKHDSKKVEEDEGLYKLYKDKAEDFICDISVEGVDSEDTEVRLIIESDDWTLMFRGEIKKGKCIIPIKKLSLFNEGQKGKIKLEVNADGNLFTPWEDDFIVKVSKKVTVRLNEKKSTKPTKAPIKKGFGVKVNVKK